MSSESETVRQVLVGLDRVGLEFVKQQKDEDAIFSPLSAFLFCVCFPYLCEGCDAAAVLKWLGVSDETSDADLADAAKWLVNKFHQCNRDPLYWRFAFTKGMDIPARCIDLVRDRVGLTIMPTHFPSPGRKHINEGIAEATHGIITNALDRYPLGRERNIVIVNAIYICSVWQDSFVLSKKYEWHLPNSSKEELFMGTKTTVKYAETSLYHYIAIPFFDEGKEMEIFLTKSKSDLPVNLTLDEMSKLRAESKPQERIIFMPKWVRESRVSVIEMLREAGVPFREPIMKTVVDIEQIAKVEVDEDQVTLVAVTTGFTEECGVDYPTVDSTPFVIDHPFIYTVRSVPVTEFIGYVYDPFDTQDRPPPAEHETRGRCSVS